MVKYLFGPVSADSSWVESYAYVQDADPRAGIRAYMGRGDEGLLITFRSGISCFYAGTSWEMYRSLDRAASKGRWIHRNIFSRHYRIIQI